MLDLSFVQHTNVPWERGVVNVCHCHEGVGGFFHITNQTHMTPGILIDFFLSSNVANKFYEYKNVLIKI